MVRAHLVWQPGAGPGQASEESLRAHCHQRLAGYKVPAEFRVEPDLPRNASGKVLKRVLREGA